MNRYRRLEVIGRGQQGLVYRAYDATRGSTLALKTLHGLDSESVYRLKREFRALANVAHPHLVELYELVIDGDEHFFTMELVDGVDLVTWSRSHTHDPTQLVSAARQLVLAIGALHDAGKLHRDVKPPNVLVEPNGRVVVLDFGLVAGTATHDGAASPGGYLTGTLPYMAPEQVWGEPPSAQADWYMVGATLYEALAGTPPFTGNALQARISGGQDPPPPPSAVSGDAPSALEPIVMGLLAFDPTARPTFADIVAHLDGDTTSPRANPTPRVRLVGREPELATLREAWKTVATNGVVRVNVHGTSGIGKTALLEHFLDERTADETPVILRGRCHPQESIPFKAVDGVVDELSRVLAGRAEDFVRRVTPPDVGALVRLFPVLGRLPPFGVAAAEEIVEGEPHEIRRRALGALRVLLARLAAETPLIVWIDDLQWGDLDSVAVLRELQRPPDSPRCLLLLSFRAEDRDVSEPLRVLSSNTDEAQQSTREIALGPLSSDDVRVLAQAGLTATDTPPADDTLLDVIASEAAGSPFFVGELVRHFAHRNESTRDAAPPDVVSVLQDRIESLPPERRRVLDLLAVAGRPLDQTLAIAAAGIDDAWSELSRLQHASLLRVITTGSGAAVAIYHDRIRDAALRLVPDAARQALHRQLAVALEARPDADPLLLVDHYLQANDPTQAARHAYASAERAEAALAFNQATQLFQRALALRVEGHPAWELEARLADALVNDGRGGEAAARYLSAARQVERENPKALDAIRLRRQAADQYLRSGYLDEGMDTLRTVLAAVGLRYPGGPRRALVALIANRARLALARAHPRPTPPHTADAFERERLDVCWTAGLGVSVFDSIRGAHFQVRHALLSLHTSDPSHRARSLVTEAVIMAMEGGAAKHSRAADFLAKGEDIARGSGDPRAEAHTLLMGAGVAFFDHRYREVLARCAEGEVLCRTRCVGVTWELANMRFLSAYALAYLGEIARLREQLPDMLTHARERGDHFALTNFRVGMIPLAWLAADQPDEARQHVTDAMEGRTPLRSAWQHYMGTYALVQIDLYEGRPEAALARLRTLGPLLRRSQMHRFQSVRLETRLLEARAHLALAGLAEAQGNRRAVAQLVKHVGRARQKIEREDARWASPLAASLAGACDALRGAAGDAIRQLRAAASGFQKIDLQLHAAAADLLILRLGGRVEERGGGNPAHPEEFMRQQAIVNPGKLAAVLIPGIP